MNDTKKITESPSNYDHLEEMSVRELLTGINREDQLVAKAVEKCIPQVEAFVTHSLKRIEMGGRLFYIGAGTSGRLGIVDASECPPTFGVDRGKVIGIIAGGDQAIRQSVELAEDDSAQGWKDLQHHCINDLDVVVGIAASGSTPYVVGAVQHANRNGIVTGGITSNPESDLAVCARYPIVPVVGPEFITGSTRMKSGTAQKLILNMISTAIMVGLGHIEGNSMVDMQLSNRKLVERGTRMLVDQTGLTYEEARSLLLEKGSVRDAIRACRK